MSPKDSKWLETHEEDVMEAVCRNVLKNKRIISMMRSLPCEEYQEGAEGLKATQLLDAIHEFLKNGPNEVNAYVFLHLLAYHPQSMTSYNLTPLMRSLIAVIYFCSQNDKELPKLSMEELAEMFHRSKSTIYDAVQKLGFLEKRIKAELEAEEIREKAKKEAYQQLIKEEKKKLKLEQNNQKNQANNQTNAIG